MFVVILGGVIVSHNRTNLLLKNRYSSEFRLVVQNLFLEFGLTFFALPNVVIQLSDLTLYHRITIFGSSRSRLRLRPILVLSFGDPRFEVFDLGGLFHDFWVAGAVTVSQLVYFAFELGLFGFHSRNFRRFLRIEVNDERAAAQNRLKIYLLLLLLSDRISIVL